MSLGIVFVHLRVSKQQYVNVASSRLLLVRYEAQSEWKPSKMRESLFGICAKNSIKSTSRGNE